MCCLAMPAEACELGWTLSTTAACFTRRHNPCLYVQRRRSRASSGSGRGGSGGSPTAVATAGSQAGQAAQAAEAGGRQ